jgi:tetratricopeptide (TPR) repeat protein
LAILTTVLLLAAAQTVKTDQFPLRSGCSESAAVVARLHAGDPVQVKFALAGGAQACYVVSAVVDGKTVQGNLPADALTGLEDFERARRAAAPVTATVSTSAPSPSAATVPMPRPKTSSPELDRAIQLMERNQPEQALEIIQKFLPLFPRNSELLALAGAAAYKSDHIAVALDYWKQSLDIKADPAVENTYRAALRESQIDKSGEKKFGTRFLLRYDGAVADSDTAGAMVAILEEEFSRISSQLGCRAEERIVTIVQTREAYMKTTGAPEWSGAGYDGKVHVPIMDRKQPVGALRQIFAHELVHACLANIGPWPQWLHEGLAQRLSGTSLETGAREEIRSLAKQGKLPTLSGLGTSWRAKTPFEAHLAYGMALVAADLFYQFHSGMGIRNLLNNPEALPSITADLDKRLRE